MDYKQFIACLVVPGWACAALAAGTPAAAEHPNLLRLSQVPPVTFDGGALRGATEESFPILKNESGSMYWIRLEKGGIREPHWHPKAWELNYVIAGTARWTILGVLGEHDSFEARKGDLVFAPRGYFHYFENGGDEDLIVLAFFNTSATEPRDDIGIVAALSAMPQDVLGAVFGVKPDAFSALRRMVRPVTITRKTTKGK